MWLISLICSDIHVHTLLMYRVMMVVLIVQLNLAIRGRYVVDVMIAAVVVVVVVYNCP